VASTSPLFKSPVPGTSAPISTAGTVTPVTGSRPTRTLLTRAGKYSRGAFAGS
jgi:hypothetical protein